MKKLVIFDLDGTLVDSLPGIARAVNELRKSKGLHELPEPEVKNMIGNGIPVLIQKAFSDVTRDNVELNNFIEEFKKYYQIYWNWGVKVFPGVSEMLSKLRNREMSLNVLSNKDEHFTREMVDKLLGNHLFDFVLGKNRFPSKPSPESVYFILKELGMHPDESVFVGDSLVDLETAKNAGMDFIGVKWGYISPHKLEGAGVRHVADKAEDIENYLVR